VLNASVHFCFTTTVYLYVLPKHILSEYSVTGILMDKVDHVTSDATEKLLVKKTC